MITKEELLVELSKFFSVDPEDKEQQAVAYSELITYLGANYSRFDKEAQQLSDTFCQVLLDGVQKNVAEMPECEEKDRLAQLLAPAKGVAYSSQQLVDRFCGDPHGDLPIHQDTKRIFLARLQDILDLLAAIRDNPHSNVDGFAKVSLFHYCVDEFLAALYLSQRNFYNQAYSHIRTIKECVEKAILFHEQPEWATLWGSTNPADKIKTLHELSPLGVRVKLGRERYDPVYSFMSEMGPHGTFRSIQSRSGVQVRKPESERTKIMMYIGGCPFEFEIIVMDFCVIYTLFDYLLSLGIVYASRLDEPRLISILTTAFSDVEFMLRTHFIPWASTAGLDVSDFVRELDALPDTIKTVVTGK